MIETSAILSPLWRYWGRVKVTWKDALCAGIAAGISWFISDRLLGHGHPIYAAMSAMVSLAPGIPNHGRQAVYVLMGVILGVLVGEATLLLPSMPTEVRIALVGFVGLTIAASYTLIPVIITQTGVSAVMVFALGADVAGTTRLIDVAVGISIGLLFSQVLFTTNPLKALQTSVERFFHELTFNYSQMLEALEQRNTNIALKALKGCARTHMVLVRLLGSIDVARNNARWSLRGRLSSRELTSLSVRYDQTAIRLYASSLLFCEALVQASRKQREQPPDWLLDALKIVVHNCRYLAGEADLEAEFLFPDRSKRGETAISWRPCVTAIEMTENALARFYKSKTRKDRLLIFRKKQILDAVREEVRKQKALKFGTDQKNDLS
ncbi:FUSC family protein [Bartonella sp. DGB2]|uniref:FUSC family protein n=1 Tax=Bartonella sp. DGB2 TaxID=3388426 RepID=UPI00399039C7